MNYEGIEYVVRASLGHNQWVVLIYYPDNADGNAAMFNFDGSNTKQGQQRDAASRIGWSDSDERSPQVRAYAHGDSLSRFARLGQRIGDKSTHGRVVRDIDPLGDPRISA